MVRSKDSLLQTIGDNNVAGAHVLVIRDAATIVDHRGQLLQHFVRDLCVRVHIQLELCHGDVEVRVIVFVGNIPAQRTELLALNHRRMVEAETKQQFLVLLRLIRALKLVIIKLQVCTRQVGAHTLGGLLGYLHTILEHHGGKCIRGHRGEPQTELWIHLLRIHTLHNNLQSGHP